MARMLDRIRKNAAKRSALDATVETKTDEVNGVQRELPLKLFLAGWSQHDPIHAADMLKALPELRDDPEIKGWIENPFVAGYQAAMNRV